MAYISRPRGNNPTNCVWDGEHGAWYNTVTHDFQATRGIERLPCKCSKPCKYNPCKTRDREKKAAAAEKAKARAERRTLQLAAEARKYAKKRKVESIEPTVHLILKPNWTGLLIVDDKSAVTTETA